MTYSWCSDTWLPDLVGPNTQLRQAAIKIYRIQPYQQIASIFALPGVRMEGWQQRRPGSNDKNLLTGKRENRLDTNRPSHGRTCECQHKNREEKLSLYTVCRTCARSAGRPALTSASAPRICSISWSPLVRLHGPPDQSTHVQIHLSLQSATRDGIR